MKRSPLKRTPSCGLEAYQRITRETYEERHERRVQRTKPPLRIGELADDDDEYGLDRDT